MSRPDRSWPSSPSGQDSTAERTEPARLAVPRTFRRGHPTGPTGPPTRRRVERSISARSPPSCPRPAPAAGGGLVRSRQRPIRSTRVLRCDIRPIRRPAVEPESFRLTLVEVRPPGATTTPGRVQPGPWSASQRSRHVAGWPAPPVMAPAIVYDDRGSPNHDGHNTTRQRAEGHPARERQEPSRWVMSKGGTTADASGIVTRLAACAVEFGDATDPGRHRLADRIGYGCVA
jgi:hypothetical protein